MKTRFALSVLILTLTIPLTAANLNPQSPLWMETAELAEKLSAQDLRVIDARFPGEYRQGHISGAVNLPAPLTDSLQANTMGYPISPEVAGELFRRAGINKSSRIVVYDAQGHRFAARIFYVLEFFGHSHVAVLNGGFPKWQSEGRPVTTNAPAVAPGDFRPDSKSGVMTTASWVREHLNDPGIQLVDARSPEEYAGSPAQGARSGHIPGAMNLEWKRLLAPGGAPTLVEISELKRLISGAGVDPQREVVVYCQSGMRASLIYFALRVLGYPQVRLYDGSWAEWSGRTDLPTAK